MTETNKVQNKYRDLQDILSMHSCILCRGSGEYILCICNGTGFQPGRGLDSILVELRQYIGFIERLSEIY